MRMDPNIILVGEIRDEETAQIAVQAALTGHLVLSSIHANDALGTLYRLLDLGVEPYLAGSALAGVVAQRLTRRVCPHCQHPVAPTTEESLAFEIELGHPPEQIYKGQGCNFCSGTGYRGRVGVFEVLTMTEKLRRMLVAGDPAEMLRDQTLTDGLIPMREDGMQKASQGITTPREVMRNVHLLR
jgi:general secretion pathway protein E